MASTFNYTVRDVNGKEVSGSLEAESEEVLSSRLRQMGYTVVSVSRDKKSFATTELHLFGSGVKKKDVVIFTRQFATMINAGLPLTRCLSILADQTDSRPFAGIISECRREVESGRSLSQALGKHPKVFSNLYVSMVRAGELGGMLDDVLLRVASQLEREMEIRSKVKSAMTYPAGMMILSMLLLLAMIVFVVPRFTSMFEELGGELPTFTKLLMAVSGFIAGWGGLLVLVLAILVILLVRRFKATDSGRMVVDRIKLKLPMVGKLFHKYAIARFSRTLGTLIGSGVPILGALEITGEAAGNKVIEKALEDVRDGVREGETIARPLSNAPVFPPMVTQMIAVGEETGALDTMLNKIGDFYESEVNASVDALTSILEPLLIVVLGGTVGIVVVALYLPVFRVITLLQ